MNWLMVWEWIKKIATWAWNHKHATMYIILIVIIMLLTKGYKDKDLKIEELTVGAKQLSDKINTLVDSGCGQVKIIYRDKEGKVIEKIQYLPPEGYVEQKTYKDMKDGYDSFLEKLRAKLKSGNATIADISAFVLGTQIDTGNGNVVIVHDRGWCARPGLFLNFDGMYNGYYVNGGVDLKLFFFQRWSAGLGTTMNYPDVWISRHVDDLIPFIPVNNAELMIGYGKPYSAFEKSVLMIGLRSNL
jgi:hypothetical protein